MPLRQWEEIQKMLRSYQLALILSSVSFAGSALAALPDNPEVWAEYGLVEQQSTVTGKLTITSYRMKDLTGALAAWEWQRSPRAHSCSLAPFCTQESDRMVIVSGNYLLAFTGATPTRDQIAAQVVALPDKRETSLPAILTFLPSEGRVPNSARYILGPQSLRAFTPELVSSQPGLEQGAEAQMAEYRLKPGQEPVKLVLFYYPTPEMARLHTVAFKTAIGPEVKRSGVLVALVYGPTAQAQAETLLSRIQYEAKITWNDIPPPSPIKPLYRLLVDILYISVLLSALALAAGLVYACMRIYRRKYGTLESEEAMTTLNLSGD